MSLITPIHPHILSLLTTYYCTAACRNCCFGCNQHRKSKMSSEQIKRYINECTQAFPTIKLVVFSGGECFSLKEDLYKSIRYAHKKGLKTRVVTNGYWAKSYQIALNILKKLRYVGLDEINLSTGDEHQEWVSFGNIINAIKASVQVNITCFVNIESNPCSKFSELEFMADDSISKYVHEKQIYFSYGTWIPYNKEDKRVRDVKYEIQQKERIIQPRIQSQGCNSLFESIPIDPYGNVFACCGLSCTKIHYLNIGNIEQLPIEKIYEEQFDDFMKLWSYVDGPKFILKTIGDLSNKKHLITSDMHNCEACLLLYNNKNNIDFIKKNIDKFIPEVILKYSIKQLKENNEK